MKKKGDFNGFYLPGRLVSTFPSMTRPAFSKMLIGGKSYHFYGFLMTDFTTVEDASRPADVARLLGRAAEAKKKGKKLLFSD